MKIFTKRGRERKIEKTKRKKWRKLRGKTEKTERKNGEN